MHACSPVALVRLIPAITLLPMFCCAGGHHLSSTQLLVLPLVLLGCWPLNPLTTTPGHPQPRHSWNIPHVLLQLQPRNNARVSDETSRLPPSPLLPCMHV